MNGPGMHSSGPRPKSHSGSPTTTSSPTLTRGAPLKCAVPAGGAPPGGQWPPGGRAAARMTVHAELLPVDRRRVRVVEDDLEITVRKRDRVGPLVEVAVVHVRGLPREEVTELAEPRHRPADLLRCRPGDAV